VTYVTSVTSLTLMTFETSVTVSDVCNIGEVTFSASDLSTLFTPTFATANFRNGMMMSQQNLKTNWNFNFDSFFI
jgi:hypothetical protein